MRCWHPAGSLRQGALVPALANAHSLEGLASLRPRPAGITARSSVTTSDARAMIVSCGSPP